VCLCEWLYPSGWVRPRVLLSIMHKNSETTDNNIDEEDFVFVEKQPFTEPIWGKVVNK